MNQFEKLLQGNDLRSLKNSKSIISKVKSQSDFDELFNYLFHADRGVVMRAADVIEKITITHPEYLSKHKEQIIGLCDTATNKELKWHLAELLPRLLLDTNEYKQAWTILSDWIKDKNNSRIVRVNCLQGLFDLAKQKEKLKQELSQTLREVEKENIPSLNARIRLLRKNKD